MLNYPSSSSCIDNWFSLRVNSWFITYPSKPNKFKVKRKRKISNIFQVITKTRSQPNNWEFKLIKL